MSPLTATADVNSDPNPQTNDSDTVVVDNVSGNIVVNQFVQGTGIDGVTRVSEIDGTTLTLSSNQTLTNNIQLTFVGAEITQAINTVINKEYIVRTRTFGGDISLKVGTSSGRAEISNTTLSIDNIGDGE